MTTLIIKKILLLPATCLIPLLTGCNNCPSTTIVEDIIDSGVTLDYLSKYFRERGAKSVAIATLLNKPARRKVDLKVDYIGFEVPDEFIVGYGIDYAENYRNLPFIGTLKPEVYEK